MSPTDPNSSPETKDKKKKTPNAKDFGTKKTTVVHLAPRQTLVNILLLRNELPGDGVSGNASESVESLDILAFPSSSTAPGPSDPSLDCGGGGGCGGPVAASANASPWKDSSDTPLPWLGVFLVFLKNDRRCCRW
jgi:hypothetical protein